MLLDSLKKETVFGKVNSQDFVEQNGKRKLEFENKSIVTVDFVMIANGGMSKARNFISDSKIEKTGTFIFKGEIYKPETSCSEFFQLSTAID